MGGNSGGIIVQHAVHDALSDPTVSGQLPAKMQPMVAAVCAKDVADWTEQDKKTAAHAISWALLNLP